MKLFHIFFATMILFLMSAPVSAERIEVESEATIEFVSEENISIVSERARTLAEIRAVDRANEFVSRYFDDLTAEQIRGVTAEVLKVKSCEIFNSDQNISCRLISTIDSNDLNSIQNVSAISSNWKTFEEKFSANDSERNNLLNAYINDRKSLMSKIESNEKNFCVLRNFLPIASIPNAASGTRANFFGIAEDINDTNGNLFFALKDPFSNAEVRCTILAKLNSENPSLHEILKDSFEKNSLIYVFGMAAKYQGQPSVMVWNVRR